MDKRRSKRIIKRLAVNFGVDDLKHTGITNDISKTGLFIKTTHFYSPGSVVKINLLIPSNGSTTFTGKVVRTYKHPPYSSLAKNGFGIELNDTENSYLTYITAVEG
ncbi:MAG: PilZ domain-containing protein [Nitrospirota bacterium]